MKKLISFCICLLILHGIRGQDLTIQDDEIQQELVAAENFINEQNAEFRNPEKSPLPDDSIPGFAGLSYFPPNDKFIVKARFEKIRRGRKFEMQTSTDRLPLYKDYALLTFYIDEKQYSLHAYQNIELSKMEGYEDYLFIPFNDHTNGIESYGGGRYLDLKMTDESSVILNFNKSYNPYCAYDSRYSCPIPPVENKLELRIEAGVKKYH